MNEYELIGYDVWGNAEDGYDINQAFYTGLIVELPDDPSDEYITEVFRDNGMLSSDIELDIQGDTEWSIYVEDAWDGLPLCELRRKRDEW